MAEKQIHMIAGTDEQGIAADISALNIGNIHCTNGTYMMPAEKIVPTFLAGFQFIDQEVAEKNDAFLVAVNSDKSMRNIMTAKGTPDAAFEPQQIRAQKMADPLAALFPDRQIIVVFYDKDTPTDLYNTLATEGDLRLASLFKWGYGTDPNAPRIEGAGNFTRVFGFPLPNDEKAICHDLTPVEDQSEMVQVLKLGQYITADNKLVFDLPESLANYRSKPAAAGSPPSPQI